MVKSKVNLVIDALMFVAMAAIGGLGFLMKWALPPGPDRLVKYGRSVEESWLGMDRHQFGTIHLYIALALLGLLVLHIVLHWGQILAIYRRLIPTSAYRWAIAILLSVVCVALLAFPLFVKPEVTEGGGHEGRLHEARTGAHGTLPIGYAAETRGSGWAEATPHAIGLLQIAHEPLSGGGRGAHAGGSETVTAREAHSHACTGCDSNDGTHHERGRGHGACRQGKLHR